MKRSSQVEFFWKASSISSLITLVHFGYTKASCTLLEIDTLNNRLIVSAYNVDNLQVKTKLLIGYSTLALESGSRCFFKIPLLDLYGYLGVKYSGKTKD